MLNEFRFIDTVALDYNDIDRYINSEYVEVKNTKTFLRK